MKGNQLKNAEKKQKGGHEPSSVLLLKTTSAWCRKRLLLGLLLLLYLFGGAGLLVSGATATATGHTRIRLIRIITTRITSVGLLLG